MGYCQQCGSQLSHNGPFCGQCGAPRPNQPVYPTPNWPPEQPKSSAVPWVVAALLGIVLIAGVIVLVFVLAARRDGNADFGRDAHADTGYPARAQQDHDQQQRAQQDQAEQQQRAAQERAEQERAQYARAIVEVIRLDANASDPMKRQLNDIKVESESDLDRMASIISGYVQQARQIDTSLCPHDFAEAYSRHVSAWAEVSDAIRMHPNLGDVVISGFLRYLDGDGSGAVERATNEYTAWENQVKVKYADINKTWNEVQALKARYGA
ncbi:MAG TPA: zinc ribbon domain-containing protein [Blastocatellia bacterium]|nr:zinc ribbon domain-containing protein [Blastocatellia bacterium]